MRPRRHPGHHRVGMADFAARTTVFSSSTASDSDEKRTPAAAPGLETIAAYDLYHYVTSALAHPRRLLPPPNLRTSHLAEQQHGQLHARRVGGRRGAQVFLAVGDRGGGLGVEEMCRAGSDGEGASSASAHAVGSASPEYPTEKHTEHPTSAHRRTRRREPPTSSAPRSSTPSATRPTRSIDYLRLLKTKRRAI
ncbi:hypothetical protein DFH09DRAFT_1374158, partial [Mycena vulgaris]